MTIIELGALGEFIGAMLLFGSLIYVGLQIKQNTNATKAQIHQARSDATQANWLLVATSELAAIHAKIMDDEYNTHPELITNLSKEEKIRLRSYHLALLNRMDNSHFQCLMGFLDRSTYEDMVERTVIRMAPIWDLIALSGGSSGRFESEVGRILKEHSRQQSK